MPALSTRALLIAALHAGCRGDSEPVMDASSGGDAVGGVMCTGAVGSFPDFDKTCGSAQDCAIGVHQTNCCGATLAIGMTTAELDRFMDAEQICEGEYPACACPATPTVAEDGRNPIAGQSIVVLCTSRRCNTAVQ